MKRPISHFLVPLACMLMLPFCLQPGSALGGDKTQSRATGHFEQDLNGNDAGWIHSVEGGSASSEVVQEKLGPVPAHSVAQPAQNLRPAPKLAAPLCPHPPCGLGNANTKPVTQQSLGDKAQKIQDDKDEHSNYAEDTAARIQMYQERRQRANDVLSDTMKKSTDTQSGITGNMK